jgi:hypothetical protein
MLRRPLLATALALGLALLALCTAGVSANVVQRGGMSQGSSAAHTVVTQRPAPERSPTDAAPCTAVPDIAALSELARMAASDAGLLLSETAAYLLQRLAPALHRGCMYISLTHALGVVDLPDNFTSPLPVDAGAARAPQRMAILLMVSDTAELVREMSRYALHVLTQWFYAKRFRYDLLIYVHRKAMPPRSPQSLFFFLKAPATQGALFLLDYSYVLYVDWDSYIAPLSAPPLDLLLLQWPRKALYVQAMNNFNAGARSRVLSAGSTQASTTRPFLACVLPRRC